MALFVALGCRLPQGFAGSASIFLHSQAAGEDLERHFDLAGLEHKNDSVARSWPCGVVSGCFKEAG